MPSPSSRPQLAVVPRFFRRSQGRYASLRSPDIELAEIQRPSRALTSDVRSPAAFRSLWSCLPASLVPRQKEHKHHHFSQCDILIAVLVLVVLALVVSAFALSEKNAVTVFETFASCTACATALAPLKVLAQAGDDVFTGVFVDFCVGSGVSRRSPLKARVPFCSYRTG